MAAPTRVPTNAPTMIPTSGSGRYKQPVGKVEHTVCPLRVPFVTGAEYLEYSYSGKMTCRGQKL